MCISIFYSKSIEKAYQDLLDIPELGPELLGRVNELLMSSGKHLWIYPHPFPETHLDRLCIALGIDHCQPITNVCMLAHELMHVIQELSGTLKKIRDEQFDWVFEREAICGVPGEYCGENAFCSYYGLPPRTSHETYDYDKEKLFSEKSPLCSYDMSLEEAECIMPLTQIENGDLLEILSKIEWRPPNEVYIQKINGIVRELGHRVDHIRLVCLALSILGCDEEGFNEPHCGTRNYHHISPKLLQDVGVSFDALYEHGLPPCIPYYLAKEIPASLLTSPRMIKELRRNPLLHFNLCLAQKSSRPLIDLGDRKLWESKFIIPDRHFHLSSPLVFDPAQGDLFRRCIRSMKETKQVIPSLMEANRELGSMVIAEIGEELRGSWAELQVEYDAGWGNFLELRGEGPSMTWEKGLPMTCIKTNKWAVLHVMPMKCPYKIVLRTPDAIYWETGENRQYTQSREERFSGIIPHFI